MGKKAKRALILLAALCLFAAVLAVTVLGTEAETPLPGIPLDVPAGDIHLLAESSAGPYIVSGQKGRTQLARLDPATGDALSNTLGYEILGASCREGLLLLYRENTGFLQAEVYDSDLQYISKNTPIDLLDDLLHYDGTAGSFYTVSSDEPTTLYQYKADGTQEAFEQTAPITLVAVTESGQLWVCTENGYQVGSAEAPERLWEVQGGTPQRIIGSNTFLDAGGSVWRVTGKTAEKLLEGLPPDSLCCADETGVVYADGTGRIHRLLWSGDELGSCLVEGGEPLALTTQSVLYQQEGLLYYAPLDFTSSAPDPTPSLEPEPSEEPIESPGPTPAGWLDERDGYFYITGEVPVEWLVKHFEPQEVALWGYDGAPIDGGTLATGMTASWSEDGESWHEARIVVWGDCDGNGRLTSADIERAQQLLLEGPGSADACYFLAADRDEDGTLTTQDLLWLSAQLAANP